MEKNQNPRKNVSFLMLAFLLVFSAPSHAFTWSGLLSNLYNRYRSQSTTCQVLLPTLTLAALAGGSWWYSNYLAKQQEARRLEEQRLREIIPAADEPDRMSEQDKDETNAISQTIKLKQQNQRQQAALNFSKVLTNISSAANTRFLKLEETKKAQKLTEDQENIQKLIETYPALKQKLQQVLINPTLENIKKIQTEFIQPILKDQTIKLPQSLLRALSEFNRIGKSRKKNEGEIIKKIQNLLNIIEPSRRQTLPNKTSSSQTVSTLTPASSHQSPLRTASDFGGKKEEEKEEQEKTLSIVIPELIHFIHDINQNLSPETVDYSSEVLQDPFNQILIYSKQANKPDLSKAIEEWQNQTYLARDPNDPESAKFRSSDEQIQQSRYLRTKGIIYKIFDELTENGELRAFREQEINDVISPQLFALEDLKPKIREGQRITTPQHDAEKERIARIKNTVELVHKFVFNNNKNVNFANHITLASTLNDYLQHPSLTLEPPKADAVAEGLKKAYSILD